MTQLTLASWDGNGDFEASYNGWNFNIHQTSGEGSFHGVPEWSCAYYRDESVSGDYISDAKLAGLIEKMEARFHFQADALIGTVA